MAVIKVELTDHVIRQTTFPVLTSGSAEEDKIHFTFDASWDGYVKTALFYRQSSQVHEAAVDIDGYAVIPSEVEADSGILSFGVAGKNGNKTKTSQIIRIDIQEGIKPPPATLTSITAAYSGGSVPEGTALADLTGIAVTGHYSDGTTSAITSGYELSGTIGVGSNTITVTYQEKTATFTVVGTEPQPVVTWLEGSGYAINNSGQMTSGSDYCTNEIDVLGRTSAAVNRINGDRTITWRGIVEYDENHSFIRKNDNGGQQTDTYTVNLQINTKYVRCTAHSPSDNTTSITERVEIVLSRNN